MTTHASTSFPTEAASAPDAHEPYASLMRYKQWADEHLLATLLARPGIEEEAQAPILREIVGHYHVVDRIFRAHLEGVPHGYTGTRLEGASTLAEMRDEVVSTDRWYVEHARSVGRDALAERLPIRFTDGTQMVLTRSDVLLHVSQHGTYHRGNAGVVLRMMGIELPPDRFTDYVADREPRG
jgi:uncharacterized damage-inducible protein DinB